MLGRDLASRDLDIRAKYVCRPRDTIKDDEETLVEETQAGFQGSTV